MGKEGMRIAAIWICGIIAGAIFGALVGKALAGSQGYDMGFFAGIFAFGCFRLWKSPTAKGKPLPVFDLKDGKLDRS